MPSIVLYALDGCPDCEPVHDALADAGVEYETRWVDPLHSDRDEVRRLSNQREVPLLIDESAGVRTVGRDNAVEYVETSLAGRDG